MAWEGIEHKLKRALTVEISFPGGTIWLPESRLSIDDWLESIAETDEELREIEIPRIRFLQNRWPVDELVELEWDYELRVINAMYVGHRAYILFSDRAHYLVIAALEPKDNPALYRAVAGKILENRNFVPSRPANIRNHHPNLIPEVTPSPTGEWTELAESRPVFGEPVPLAQFAWKGFLSEVLVGWIGKWLNLPELGFWHEDMPESITRTNEGEILMKYRRSSGDRSEKKGRQAS